jgi:hypothetical protein
MNLNQNAAFVCSAKKAGLARLTVALKKPCSSCRVQRTTKREGEPSAERLDSTLLEYLDLAAGIAK